MVGVAADWNTIGKLKNSFKEKLQKYSKNILLWLLYLISLMLIIQIVYTSNFLIGYEIPYKLNGLKDSAKKSQKVRSWTVKRQRAGCPF